MSIRYSGEGGTQAKTYMQETEPEPVERKQGAINNYNRITSTNCDFPEDRMFGHPKLSLEFNGKGQDQGYHQGHH